MWLRIQNNWKLKSLECIHINWSHLHLKIILIPIKMLLLMCSNLCILAASINNNNIHRRNQLNSLKSLYSSFSKNLKFYLLYKCGFCHRPDQTEQWSRGQEHRGSGIHNSRELVIRFVCKLSIKWRICMKHIWVFRKET